MDLFLDHFLIKLSHSLTIDSSIFDLHQTSTELRDQVEKGKDKPRVTHTRNWKRKIVGTGDFDPEKPSISTRSESSIYVCGYLGYGKKTHRCMSGTSKMVP